VALTSPVGAITAAFPAITAVHFAFAPIFKGLLWTVLTTAVARWGEAKGRTSGVTSGCNQSSKPPKDISEGIIIVGNRVVDRGCGTGIGIALLMEVVDASR